MGKVILVVDDNPDVRFTIRSVLEEQDRSIEVIEIENGEQCINYLESHNNPDLILLDIMMPGLDGWAVAAKMKKHPSWKTIPFFFLTAKIDGFSQSFGKIVCDTYITKPFEIAELQKLVSEKLR